MDGFPDSSPLGPAPRGAAPGHGPGGPAGLTGIPLSTSLVNDTRHPVIIFGVSASGKTNIVLSLLRYLSTQTTARDVSWQLGPPILNKEHPLSGQKHADARRLTTLGLHDFMLGIAAESTQIAPFFIPLDIRIGNDLPTGRRDLKLALMDSRGEDIHIDRQSEGLYPDFRPEIVELLREHAGPVSLIHVLPCADPQDDMTLEDRNRIDFAILGCINQYQTVRKDRIKDDRHLLVATKWDMLHRAGASPEFSAPTEAGVIRELETRYPMSWGAFSTLPYHADEVWRLKYMPYSAGFFPRGAPAAVPMILQPQFDSFARNLMHWLSRGGLANEREFIFVTEPEPVAGPGMWEQLAIWLSGARRTS